MKVLVTGATGFIGPWVVGELLDQGWSVTVLVRPGREERLRSLRTTGGGPIVLESCAHTGYRALRTAEFDAVVNLVGPGVDSWATNWQANVEYVRDLAGSLRQLSVGRVVHFSSISVYGLSTRNKGARITEDDRLVPDDWYGVTKVLGERIWRAYYAETHVPVTLLRPSWVIGRGSHLLDRYLVAAAQTGLLVRMLPKAPFNGIYVRDVARATVMAIRHGSSSFEAYNLNGAGGQFGQFVEALRHEISRAKIPLPLPEVAVRVLARKFGSLGLLVSGVQVDATKASRELHFVPRYDVRSIVRGLVNGELPSMTPLETT